MPCPECGESLDLDARVSHECDEARWADYQLFQLRDEIEALEPQIASYLASPRGRFELWYAARNR
ncbi:MAG: hypothetical protein QOJ43_894 [Gaiellaceae bacterium]|jgi:hypothetical protein|nr:hypothetical protein [Gaiellaceae bacterium]